MFDPIAMVLCGSDIPVVDLVVDTSEFPNLNITDETTLAKLDSLSKRGTPVCVFRGAFFPYTTVSMSALMVNGIAGVSDEFSSFSGITSMEGVVLVTVHNSNGKWEGYVYFPQLQEV